MADQVFMYGIVVGAFAVLTGILFSSRAKRKSEERKSTAPSTSRGRKERRNLEYPFIIFKKCQFRLCFFPSEHEDSKDSSARIVKNLILSN